MDKVDTFLEGELRKIEQCREKLVPKFISDEKFQLFEESTLSNCGLTVLKIMEAHSMDTASSLLSSCCLSECHTKRVVLKTTTSATLPSDNFSSSVTTSTMQIHLENDSQQDYIACNQKTKFAAKGISK
jgi:hypothetical protein